ncbi:MAG: DUF6148 family protein [Deltaproteobacteria bacterium]|jgi:hypothetical protein|nr:DUF6148 family protein [Deltaproteobacteria bacterium]
MSASKKYRGYTLEEAKTELELWKKVKRAAATGKSYMIDSRQLTRHDLAEINQEIDRFSAIVDALSTGRSGPVRTYARQSRW